MLKLTDYIGLGNAEYSDTLIGLRISTRLHIGGKAGPSYIDVLLSGVSPLALTNALGLNYIKALGATEQRNLPSGYTQVEYLESSGSQYIDTGVKPNGNYTVIVKGKYNNLGTGVNKLYGSRTNAGSKEFIFTAATTNGQMFNISYGTNIIDSAGIFSDTNVHIFKLSKGIGYVDNTVVKEFAQQNFEGDYSLYLFGANYAGTANGLSNTRIYYEEIYNGNDTLIQNLIPCRRNSDSVLGMYDTVTGNFLTNSGTGTFTAGADIVPTPDTPMDIVCNNGVVKAKHQSGLPLGYTLLDYIEFSGTQYIDTGVKFSGSVTELDTTMAVTSLGTAMTLAATQNNSVSPARRWGSMQWVNSSNKFGTAVGSISLDRGLLFDASVNVQTYIKIITNDTNKSLTATYGDITQTMTYEGSLDTNLNLLIGAKNTNTGVSEYFNGKVYSMSLKIDDVLMFNFVPVRRLSDNVLGMYDLVNGQFFTNAGTGDFTAGNLVNDPAEIYTDGTVETVEITGKNLLDSSLFEVGGVRSNGADIADSDGRRTPYVEVKSNTTYTFSGLGDISAYYASRGAMYDENKTYIQSITGSSVTSSFTTTGNTKYIRLTLWRQEEQLQCQLELGSTATTYEPYYYGGSATAEMLLKVGDYKDNQELLTGNITRNVGIKVFDGTEDWSAGTFANRYTLAAAFNDLADLIDNNIGYSNCYTVISRSTSIQSSLQNNECGWNTTKVFCVRDDRIATLADWTQYLASQYANGTPVIIVYPLATPTTESVTGQSLTASGNCTVTATGSLDNLELELSYKQGVTVRVRETSNENLDNEVNVTIS